MSEQEVCGDVVRAPQLCLAPSAVLRTPTQNAFNHLAAGLRRDVARVPCCSPVNGASPVRVVLRDRRRDGLRAHAFDVFFDVVGLVHACGAALSRRRVLCQHFFGRLPLRRAGCLRHDTLDGEAVSVLHRGVPPVAARALLAR